jgi:hypothetical protein
LLGQLLEHKTALFSFLEQRWKALFQAKFDVLLYDLTSTYFEADPPEAGKRRVCFGYSRDKRPDCVQSLPRRKPGWSSLWWSPLMGSHWPMK